MDDQDIKMLVLRTAVRADTFVAKNLPLEGVLDIGAVPALGLRLVNMIEQIRNEFSKSRSLKPLGKGLANEPDCLDTVHSVSRYDDRMTSRRPS